MYEGDFDMTGASQSGANEMFGLFGWLIIFALYFYFAYMQYKIACKCNCSNSAWWAFIPVMNTVLLIKMAGKPMWWFILLLIPMVNLIMFFMLWITVAKNCGHSPVWGFMVMIPLINFIAMYLLAFKGPSYSYPSTPSQPTQSQTPQQVG